MMRNHLRLVLDRDSGELVRVDRAYSGDPAPLASVPPRSPAAPVHAHPVPVSPHRDGAEFGQPKPVEVSA